MTFVKIKLTCPTCQSEKIQKNGTKKNQKQNYKCKDCGRQFVSDYFLKNQGSKSTIDKKIILMLVRGVGVRDIAVIENVSVNKILKTIEKSNYEIIPRQKHYKRIEIDEFWTYVQKKSNKIWLIYAYCRKNNEIIAYVWGKRDLATAKLLRNKIIQLGVTYDYISIDKWDSFLIAFEQDKKLIGKFHTLGIERNNCRLRHRVKRAVRNSCNFSKKFDNHVKVFDAVFYYINYGHV